MVEATIGQKRKYRRVNNETIDLTKLYKESPIKRARTSEQET